MTDGKCHVMLLYIYIFISTLYSLPHGHYFHEDAVLGPLHSQSIWTPLRELKAQVEKGGLEGLNDIKHSHLACH